MNPPGPASHTPTASPLLAARGLTKAFPGVQALDGVHLTLRAGEIHALMGENGAGKSTLIKLLTGVYRPGAGAIELAGRPVAPRSPQEAEALGISTVYQEINLVPTLSVAENIVLGREPRRWGCIRWSALRQRASAALQRLDLRLDLRRTLNTLPIALQQMVAIARALDVQAQLLILDEPTSSLDEQEVEVLFQLLRRLRDHGLAILFVTHFLDQVYALTDRITVLRNGQFVSETPTAQLPRLNLIGHMLGKRPDDLPKHGPSAAPRAPTSSSAEPPPDAVIEARGLGRRGALDPLDLTVHTGEVVGLAGLLGSGRTETARLLFGIDHAHSGEIRVAGRPAPIRSPRDAMRFGLAFCSEDRKTEGIIPHLSVRENLILALQASRGVARMLSRREQEQLAQHYIQALNIKTPSPETPIRNLSGGNQQKVLLARWLALQPRLLILDEPTRGIDVGAKAEIEKLIRRLREQGLGVLFISSELEEVVRLSGRVVVLRDHRKVGELSAPLDEPQIMQLMAHHHG